jgi:hypothetical protein
MLRKVKYLFIIAMMFLLTGCVKFNMTMDIKSDKSMDLDILYAVDKNMMGDEELFKDEDIEEYKKSGFEVKDYAEGDYVGITLKKHVKNIDDISKTDGNASFNIANATDTESEESMFTLKKGFFRNVYTLKMESDSATNTPDDINLGDERIALEGEDDDLGDYPTDGESLLDDYPIDGDVDYTEALNNMEMNLTVNLPNKPISHNATSVSNNGKSLTWNLVAQQSDVELTFALYNKTNILICVAGVVVVVIVVIVVISKSSKNKNTSNNQTTNNAQNNEMMNNNTMNNNTMNNNTVDNNTMVDNTMTDSSSINNQPEVNNNPEIINNSDNVPNSNGMTNDGVNNVPADGIDGINSSNQDDIFPDNQPNNEPNNDGTPLEDLFNNNTNNN